MVAVGDADDVAVADGLGEGEGVCVRVAVGCGVSVVDGTAVGGELCAVGVSWRKPVAA